ncbi:uncharacterized protein LOC124159849 isoform X2 [Ischnura elegans]|uniref:uncharacterized protein LOC124159849 isoform X2 n=1 Tax=Ischnura elegans TaxID=197161 RepID=UPI001ED88058|nr:uncharacterized protein LOC124159849 isoform X2 [Ischnura elegans]
MAATTMKLLIITLCCAAALGLPPLYSHRGQLSDRLKQVKAALEEQQSMLAGQLSEMAKQMETAMKEGQSILTDALNDGSFWIQLPAPSPNGTTIYVYRKISTPDKKGMELTTKQVKFSPGGEHRPSKVHYSRHYIHYSNTGGTSKPRTPG